MLLGERAEAQHLLERFRADFPTHELNAYVTPYLAATIARKGNIQGARTLYAESLERHPKGTA